jgi:hypothetical protein
MFQLTITNVLSYVISDSESLNVKIDRSDSVSRVVSGILYDNITVAYVAKITMSKPDSIFLRALRWIQKWMVQTIVVPHDPFDDLNIDPTKPLVYLMKTESISDIAALSEITEGFGLPSPYEPLQLDGLTVPRVVCLEGRKPLFGKRESGDKFLNYFTSLLSLHSESPELDTVGSCLPLLGTYPR